MPLSLAIICWLVSTIIIRLNYYTLRMSFSLLILSFAFFFFFFCCIDDLLADVEMSFFKVK